MACPEYEALMAYAAGEGEGPDAAGVVSHVASGCAACRADLDAIEALRRLSSAADSAPAPPPWVLNRAARIPTNRLAASRIYRVASLVFDTLRDPTPAGARSAARGSRQMLFSEGDVDLDVRVTPAGEGRARVAGQVLPAEERGAGAFATFDVTLVHPDRGAVTVRSNDLGEFAFDAVAEGDYSLLVEVDGETLLVESLPARGAPRR
jgi:hypothetical protein